MIFYLKEEFLSFDHFDIWDENENLVYSANREFFNFGKKLIVQDASGRQAAAVQHVPFSLPCTYALTIGELGIRPDAEFCVLFPQLFSGRAGLGD